MSRRSSRFRLQSKLSRPYRSRPEFKNFSKKCQCVYKDSSFFIFLKHKLVDTDFSSEYQLPNASELAKPRKIWPFFSEIEET